VKRALVLVLVAALAAMAPALAHADYHDTVLATHPAGYWPLDETSGTTAFDLSGGHHEGGYNAACCGVTASMGADGAPVAGAGSTGYHIHGNVSVFSGADPGGRVSVPTAGGWAQWGGRSPFSVNVWLKWDGYAKSCVSAELCSDLTEGIVGNLTYAGSGSFAGWGLELPGATAARGDGRIHFIHQPSTADGSVLGPALAVGQWTMVTATYDGLTMRVYVNGGLEASHDDPTGIGGGAGSLFIGALNYNRDFSGYWGSFNGTLDEVGYWNRALGEDEIQGLYTGAGVNQKPTVYFVPGIGGSEIADEAGALWPDAIVTSQIPFFNEVGALAVADDGTTPDHFTYAPKVLDSAFGSDYYGSFLGELNDLVSDGTISKFVPWPYDWRIGVRTEAARLADRLETDCGNGRTWLVGHSTGGLVIKAALRLMREDGKDPEHCLGGGGVVFLATPHLGAPKAIGSEINPDIFFGIATNWKDELKADLADEGRLAHVLRNWLTPYELMPAQGDAAVPADARELWFDDLHDGLGDQNVNGDALSAYLPLAAHTSFVYDSDYAAVLGQLPVYNVFGFSKATPESYGPGTCTEQDGTRTFEHVLDNVHEDAVTFGDGTVPAWSAAWLGAPVPLASQYGVANTGHLGVPKADSVLLLFRRIFAAKDPKAYPDVPGLEHGSGALERASTAIGPGYETTVCSPVAVTAHYDGAEVGVTPDGVGVDTTDDGSWEPAIGNDGFHGGTLFLPDHGVAPPIYDFTAIGDGRVVVQHTDPDGSQHDFVFFVRTGDKAELAKGPEDWELTIDRGGDGSDDETIVANQLSLDLELGGGSGADGTGDFGEFGSLSLDADALSADGSDLEYEWEILDDDGDGSLDDEGDLVVSADRTHAVFRAKDGPKTVRIRVTVRNRRGMTASAIKTVQVPNTPPTVDAGPDATAPWGVPMTQRGSVTDASAADRAAGLHPHWRFGDGAEADGAVATHAYAEPGVYTATLTATDKDGASASDTATVTVTARGASVAWTGSTSAVYGFASLSARVTEAVDPATARLAGLPVTISVDGLDLAATTQADGTVRVETPLPLALGAHDVTVRLDSTRLYDGASARAQLVIANGAGKATGGVTTEGVDTAGGAKASFTVQSDGGPPKGELQWRGADGTNLHVADFTAVGFAADGSAAWASGRSDAGDSVVLHLVVSPPSVELWLRGVRQPGSGPVVHGSLTVH
jgi:PKD repeat protein